VSHDVLHTVTFPQEHCVLEARSNLAICSNALGIFIGNLELKYLWNHGYTNGSTVSVGTQGPLESLENHDSLGCTKAHVSIFDLRGDICVVSVRYNIEEICTQVGNTLIRFVGSSSLDLHRKDDAQTLLLSQPSDNKKGLFPQEG
jgi:hypothetical protein